MLLSMYSSDYGPYMKSRLYRYYLHNFASRQSAMSMDIIYGQSGHPITVLPSARLAPEQAACLAIDVSVLYITRYRTCVHISPPLSRTALGVFYACFYDHARRLEKRLYLERSRSSKGRFTK
jgi:hypothetical protein